MLMIFLTVVEGIDFFGNGLAGLVSKEQFAIIGLFAVIGSIFVWLFWASRIDITAQGITWRLIPMQRQHLSWQNIKVARLVSYGTTEAKRVGFRGPGLIAIVLYPRNGNEPHVRIPPKIFSEMDLQILSCYIMKLSPDVVLDRYVAALAKGSALRGTLGRVSMGRLAGVMFLLLAVFIIIGVIRAILG